MKTKASEFLYEYKGDTVRWKIIEPRGRGFLCEISNGPHKGQRAEFANATIRFGQLRLKQSGDTADQV